MVRDLLMRLWWPRRVDDFTPVSPEALGGQKADSQVCVQRPAGSRLKKSQCLSESKGKKKKPAFQLKDDRQEKSCPACGGRAAFCSDPEMVGYSLSLPRRARSSLSLLM